MIARWFYTLFFIFSRFTSPALTSNDSTDLKQWHYKDTTMSNFNHFPNHTLSDIFGFNLKNMVMNRTGRGFGSLNGSMPMPKLSAQQIAQIFREQYINTSMSNFDSLTQVALIVAFALLIVFGATGNGLVCYVVAKNPNMRTPRNIFIINLAISDLTLW